MEMIAIFLIMKWFVDENNRKGKRGDRGKRFIYLIKWSPYHLSLKNIAAGQLINVINAELSYLLSLCPFLCLGQ